MNNESTKHCSKCNRDLPLTAFAKRSASSDGLQSQCRQCRGAATNEPTYKTHPLKLPKFIPTVWLAEFLRATATCLWCSNKASCVVIEDQVVEPDEDVVEQCAHADAWCGECNRRENIRSKMERKSRIEGFEDRVKEAYAWHDSRLADKRKNLDSNNALPGHRMAVEGFMRRASNEREDYFDVIERHQVFDSKQIAKRTNSEVSYRDEHVLDGILNGDFDYDSATNRIRPVGESTDY